MTVRTLLFSLIAVIALFSTPAGAQSRTALSPERHYSRLSEADFPPYLKEAFGRFQQRDYEAAMRIADKSARSAKRPAAPEKLYFLQGLSEQARGRNTEAIALFRKSLALRGSDSDVYFFMGLSQLQAGDARGAADSFNDALWFGRTTHLKPADLNLCLAYAYRTAGDNIAAGKALSAALAMDPGLEGIKSELGAMQLEAGGRVAAIKLLREATAASPSDDALKLQLAGALLHKADRVINRADLLEARALTTALMNQNSLDYGGRTKLAPLHIRALMGTGDLAGARRSLDDALKADPGNPELKVLEGHLNMESAIAPADAPRTAG